MKYIKAYENFNFFKYNIGDYVLLYNKLEYNWTIDLRVKIIGFEGGNYKMEAHEITPNYKLGVTSLNTVIFTHLKDDIIERKLTPEEIDEFEMMLQANKYNL